MDLSLIHIQMCIRDRGNPVYNIAKKTYEDNKKVHRDRLKLKKSDSRADFQNPIMYKVLIIQDWKDFKQVWDWNKSFLVQSSLKMMMTIIYEVREGQEVSISGNSNRLRWKGG